VVVAVRRLGGELESVKDGEAQEDRELAAALTAKLDQLAADYAADLITREQMLTSTGQTRQRLAEVEARVAERQREDVLADLPIDDPEEFLALPLGTQRTIIAKVFTEIVVGPATTRGPGFERGRVRLA
jgi:site-specific DNA recombinase